MVWRNGACLSTLQSLEENKGFFICSVPLMVGPSTPISPISEMISLWNTEEKRKSGQKHTRDNQPTQTTTVLLECVPIGKRFLKSLKQA